MELTEAVKTLLQEAARALRGSARRRFIARTVAELGPGGRRRAEREVGWCRTTRLYTRLTAAEARQQLVVQKGYTDAQLPSVQTIGAKRNALGYHPQTVAKSKPQERSRPPTPSSPR